MLKIIRSPENPILGPDSSSPWEAEAAFNGCPVSGNGVIHFLYRAQSRPKEHHGRSISLSTIGYARSRDGIHFKDRRQFIVPEQAWEQFGCEDPRVTRIGDTFYIFYTALSDYPFTPEGIHIGVILTKDFKTVEEKRQVTHFNSKAMALFPEAINGKMAAVLTVNTDRPPAKIALAMFDRKEDIWSREKWDAWLADLPHRVLSLQRTPHDHIEVGAPPVKTKEGWLLFYSYIRNYSAPPATFGIEAVLLDLKNPLRIIARTNEPIMTPQEEYERYGKVPNIIFPSGAMVRGRKLFLYYGGADTTCCVATMELNDALKEILSTKTMMTFDRADQNPVIAPDPAHEWEAKAAFNPGVVQDDKKIHIVYRAMSWDNTSVLGYASTIDGIHIDERMAEPMYVPREPFEQKIVPHHGNSGCEDPRLTRIGNRIYMCYTAFDGKNPPRVALTSIAYDDFISRQWRWSKPVLISPPEVDDKDAAIFPKLFGGKYAFLHRLGVSIWIDFIDRLDEFDGVTKWLKGKILMSPRTGPRDSRRIGIAGPPIETEEGWLLLYHGISKKEDHHYHVRAALLDRRDPAKVLARSKDPIFEPEMPYEREGIIPNVVFPCGAAILGDRLHLYYGAADRVTGVASAKLSEILATVRPNTKKKTK